MQCFKCGTNNPRSNNYCLNCNSLLPKVNLGEEIYGALNLMAGEDILESKQSIYAKNLREAVEKLNSKAISPAEFSVSLSDNLSKVSQAIRNLRKIEGIFSTQETTKVADLIFEAYLKIIEAIGKFSSYLEDKNREYLSEAESFLVISDQMFKEAQDLAQNEIGAG
ncbi:MAG: zinc ribbon domain-containing protein [Armatimonadetes bacterium]|nr:zinc ribbon domain-containing protein [Armatimonadota bacterium]